MRHADKRAHITPKGTRLTMHDIAKAFRVVDDTPEGRIVLGYIIQELCHLGSPLIPDRTLSNEELRERAALFDVGRRIEQLLYAEIVESEKPNVKTKPEAEK